MRPRSFQPIGLFLAIGSAVTSPQQALAQTAPEIDGIQTDSGETEIEIETRIVDAGDGTGIQWQIQGEHALDKRWALGAEIELERDPGEALVADTALARVKWRAPRKQGGIALALQLGAGYSFSKQAAALEGTSYAGWSKDEWSLAGRFRMEQLLERRAEPKFGYRLKVAREIVRDIELGVEADGDIWSDADPKHRIGPFIQIPLGKDHAPVLELGAFAGLTQASPDMVYRIELEFEL